MNNKRQKNVGSNNRAKDDRNVVRSSSDNGSAGKGKIETLQIQVAQIEQLSDQSNTTINDADANANDTNSMRIILPVFIENEQKYAQMEHRRRKIQSSPAKAMRRFSQDLSALEQQKPASKVSASEMCATELTLFSFLPRFFCCCC